MKRSAIIALVILFGVVIGSTMCGDDDPPRAMVSNLSSETVNISIKQGTNPTTNVNNVYPGTSSDFVRIYVGAVQVTGFHDIDYLTFNAEVNGSYRILVKDEGSTVVVGDQ